MGKTKYWHAPIQLNSELLVSCLKTKICFKINLYELAMIKNLSIEKIT